MNVALLDPILFEPRSEDSLISDLNVVIAACARHGYLLLPVQDYWVELWTEKVRPLSQGGSPLLRQAVQELQRLSQRSVVSLPDVVGASTAWKNGFLDMFGVIGEQWPQRMANAAVRVAGNIGENGNVVLFTRKVVGRNVTVHSAGDSTLDEITRWILHVQPRGGHKQIPCVYNLRNLSERFTIRFDWRLPTENDGGAYPFYYPDQWWKKTTKVFGTMQSKYCWRDVIGNGWARPNISGGQGYHWDVYMSDVKLQERIGVSQINVKEFGSTLSEGDPGMNHHIPKAKKSAVNNVGWKGWNK